jgi:hypothetical protein
MESWLHQRVQSQTWCSRFPDSSAANVCQDMCCAVLCVLQTEPVSEAKLKAAAGLAQLDGRRYKAAARAFVSVNPELGTTYSEVSATHTIVWTPEHSSSSSTLQAHAWHLRCRLDAYCVGFGLMIPVLLVLPPLLLLLPCRSSHRLI